MTKLPIISAAASLLLAGSAFALPIAPVPTQSNVTQARTVCDEWGRCCASGSGQCFYQGPPRRVYREQPRRYYAPPAYGYGREPYVQRRQYYGGGYGW